MSILPDVENALLHAIAGHQRQRLRWRRHVIPRGVLAVVLACVSGSGVAIATGAWPVGGGKGIVAAVRAGGHPLAPAGPLRILGREGQASLARYRGQVVVMSFWAPWCEPCIQQTRALLALDRDMRERREGIVAVIAPVREAGDAARELDRGGRGLAIFLAAEGFVKRYGTDGLPTTFIVDRDGRVNAYFEGLASLARLRALVREVGG